MMKGVIVISCVYLISFFGKAQDVHFTQFEQNPMFLNPALTGQMDGGFRVTGQYNSQWIVTGASYNTMSFSVDAPILKGRKGSYLGVGANFLKDKAGDSEFGFINAGMSLSGILKISNQSEISLGIRSAFVQRTISNNNLQWDNQFNGTSYNSGLAGEIIGSPSFSYFDFSTGLNYHFNRRKSTLSGSDQLFCDAGVFYNHLTQPGLQFAGAGDPLAARIGLYGNVQIDLRGTRYFINPNLLVQKQMKQKEIVIGGFFGYKIVEDTKYTGFSRKSSVAFGAYYRVGDAFAPAIMYEVADFSLKVSYDITLSKLSQYTSGRGGFEVSLVFRDAQNALFGGNGMHKSFM